MDHVEPDRQGLNLPSLGSLRVSDAGVLCCSCISWSSYHKNLLASSDYEGTVILWDGFTGQKSKVYQVCCWTSAVLQR